MLTVVATPYFALAEPDRASLATAHPRVRLRQVASPDEFLEDLREADGVVSGYGFRPEHLAAARRLRWLQTTGAGVEGLLFPELVASDVVVTATKGPMGATMAEHAVMLMLAIARRLPAFFRDQQARRWSTKLVDFPPVAELYQSTVLVLGYGSVGSEVARMCRHGFQSRVLAFARHRRDTGDVDRWVDRADLHDALAEADFVVVTLPNTPDTYHLLDAAALAACKPTAILVNVSRGRIVDEPALVDALSAGRLAGAGLDVVETEPLPADSLLWRLPNVVITPHMSAITTGLSRRIAAFWRENIRRFAEGEPLLGLVDKRAGY